MFRLTKLIGWNLFYLLVILVVMEIVLRLIFFGPQELRTSGSDSPWLLQTPERFIRSTEHRQRLPSHELDRLNYSARLHKLYQMSGYKIYGDLEPNRDVLFLGKTDHPYRMVTNSSGFRRKEQLTEKSENTIRILALGDSFTFGSNVSNGDTYPDIAETLLNKDSDNLIYEVLNAGVVGYFMRREKELYIQQARKVDPDIVLLQVLDNDLSGYIKARYVESDFPTPIHETYPRPPSPNMIREKMKTLKYRSVSFVKTHSDKVALFYFATRLIDLVHGTNVQINDSKNDKDSDSLYARPTRERDPVALELWVNPDQASLREKAKFENEKDFSELVEAVKSDGATLMVMYIPTDVTLDMHDSGHDPVNEYYKTLSEKYDVEYLSLLEPFASDPKRHTLYLWPWDLHPSSFGYYKIASVLKERILEIPRTIR